MSLTFICAVINSARRSSISVRDLIWRFDSLKRSRSRTWFLRSKFLFSSLMLTSYSIKILYVLLFYLVWSTFSLNVARYLSIKSEFISPIDYFLINASCSKSSIVRNSELMSVEEPIILFSCLFYALVL